VKAVLEPAQAIVVLGARVHPGGVASGALRARVERGAALFEQGLAPWLVFSGGVATHPPAEALVARGLARSLGVPASACLVETESRTTQENAVFTARLLKARGLSSVLLVSDPFHLFRAVRHFWWEGIDARPVATAWRERGLGKTELVLWSVRELPALLRRPWLFAARRPPPR
jgi:uncharacterized SAM-binding protein YcdF (DUF218 family)